MNTNTSAPTNEQMQALVRAFMLEQQYEAERDFDNDVVITDEDIQDALNRVEQYTPQQKIDKVFELWKREHFLNADDEEYLKKSFDDFLAKDGWDRVIAYFLNRWDAELHDDDLNDTEQATIDYLSDNPLATNKDIAEHLGKSDGYIGSVVMPKLYSHFDIYGGTGTNKRAGLIAKITDPYTIIRRLYWDYVQVLDYVKLSFDARGLRLEAETEDGNEIDVHFYSISAARDFLRKIKNKREA